MITTLRQIPQADLKTIALEISRAHRAAQAALSRGLEYALLAGDLLIGAKEQVPHGEWQGWVEENCCFAFRTAQLYIRLAKHRPAIEAKAQQDALLGIDGAIKLLADEKWRQRLPDEARQLLSGETAGHDGGITEEAAREFLRLDILNKVATVKIPNRVVNEIARNILWDNNRARTHEDVTFLVDGWLAELFHAYRLFRDVDAESRAEAIRQDAITRWRNGGDREPTADESAAWLCLRLRPDFSRLSAEQVQELAEVAWRWIGELGRRAPAEAA